MFLPVRRKTPQSPVETFPSRRKAIQGKRGRKSKPDGRKSKNFPSANRDFSTGCGRFQEKIFFVLSPCRRRRLESPPRPSNGRGQRQTTDAQASADSDFPQEIVVDRNCRGRADGVDVHASTDPPQAKRKVGV